MKTKILKKKEFKNSKQPTLIGKDEMNLAEFPFTVLSHKIAKSKKTIEWNTLVPGRDGKMINQEWIVTSSDKYGLPHPIDNDFYLGIMLFLKRNNFHSRTIYFREYDFLKTIGKDDSKRNYKELQQAFARLKGVSIYATNAFWDNKEKCYLKSVEAFGIIDNYRLLSIEKKIEGDQPLPSHSSVSINEVLFQSIENSYIKSLDLSFYFSLKTPLTKRLFRYLDKNRYKKETYEIELPKLVNLLPIKDKNTYEIKRRLKNPHKELIDKGFLESINYSKTRTGEHKVIYTFAKAKFLEPEQIDLLIQIPEFSISQEVNALLDHGVTEVVAHELVKKYPDRITKHTDILDYLIEKKDPKVSKNPAGFLCKSIEKDFAPPKNYILKEQRQKIQEQEIQEYKRQKDEQKAVVEAETAWDNKVNKFIATLPADEQKNLRQQAEQNLRKKSRGIIDIAKGFFLDMEIRKIATGKYCLTPEKLESM